MKTPEVGDRITFKYSTGDPRKGVVCRVSKKGDKFAARVDNGAGWGFATGYIKNDQITDNQGPE